MSMSLEKNDIQEKKGERKESHSKLDSGLLMGAVRWLSQSRERVVLKTSSAGLSQGLLLDLNLRVHSWLDF